jgi:hypothetical protein
LLPQNYDPTHAEIYGHNSSFPQPLRRSEYRHRGERCEHGFLVELSICPTCNPSPRLITPTQIGLVLSMLAARQHRRRLGTGRFAALRTEAGEYICWACRQPKPLTAEFFFRCMSKAHGFQDRCKKCDNLIKTLKRKGLNYEQIQLELARMREELSHGKAA